MAKSHSPTSQGPVTRNPSPTSSSSQRQGVDVRPEMIIARARYDICRSNRCGKFSRDFCSVFKGGCGCHLNPSRGAAVPAKTKLMGQACPDGHWPAMTRADINAVLTDVAEGL